MMTRNCRCGGKLVMRRKRTFDRETVIWACEDCHRGDGAVSRRDIAALSYEQLRDMPRATIVKRKRPNSKRRSYAAHLHSAEWKRIRSEVLERDKFECQIRLDGCTRSATEVDHKSYENFTNERPEELRAACRSCNQNARSSRIAFGR